MSLNMQFLDCSYGGRCEGRAQPTHDHGPGLTPGPLSFLSRYMRYPTRSTRRSCRLGKPPSGMSFWTRLAALSGCFFSGLLDAGVSIGKPTSASCLRGPRKFFSAASGGRNWTPVFTERPGNPIPTDRSLRIPRRFQTSITRNFCCHSLSKMIPCTCCYTQPKQR